MPAPASETATAPAPWKIFVGALGSVGICKALGSQKKKKKKAKYQKKSHTLSLLSPNKVTHSGPLVSFFSDRGSPDPDFVKNPICEFCAPSHSTTSGPGRPAPLSIGEHDGLGSFLRPLKRVPD